MAEMGRIDKCIVELEHKEWESLRSRLAEVETSAKRPRTDIGTDAATQVTTAAKSAAMRGVKPPPPQPDRRTGDSRTHRERMNGPLEIEASSGGGQRPYVDGLGAPGAAVKMLIQGTEVWVSQWTSGRCNPMSGRDGNRMWIHPGNYKSEVCCSLNGFSNDPDTPTVRDDVLKRCEEFGPVVGFHVRVEEQSNRYHGCGYVQYRDPESLRRAIEGLSYHVPGSGGMRPKTIRIAPVSCEFNLQALLGPKSVSAPRVSLTSDPAVMHNPEGKWMKPPKEWA